MEANAHLKNKYAKVIAYLVDSLNLNLNESYSQYLRKNGNEGIYITPYFHDFDEPRVYDYEKLLIEMISHLTVNLNLKLTSLYVFKNKRFDDFEIISDDDMPTDNACTDTVIQYDVKNLQFLCLVPLDFIHIPMKGNDTLCVDYVIDKGFTELIRSENKEVKYFTLRIPVSSVRSVGFE